MPRDWNKLAKQAQEIWEGMKRINPEKCKTTEQQVARRARVVFGSSILDREGESK